MLYYVTLIYPTCIYIYIVVTLVGSMGFCCTVHSTTFFSLGFSSGVRARARLYLGRLIEAAVNRAAGGFYLTHVWIFLGHHNPQSRSSSDPWRQNITKYQYIRSIYFRNIFTYIYIYDHGFSEIQKVQTTIINDPCFHISICTSIGFKNHME